MKIATLRPDHLRRYRDVLRLLIRHGSVSWFRAIMEGGLLEDEWPREEAGSGNPEKLASDLEELGPTFVKLGQLLSTRADLLPPAYLQALGRLQDHVEPFPFEQVRQKVEDELGIRIDDAFSSFDETPLASASIAQVHRARLGDDRLVAVKVQRPGIRRTILRDLDAFDEVARVLDEHTDIGRRYAFLDMLEELKATLLRELDFRCEAQSLTRMRENLEGRSRLLVPEPFDRLSSSTVLTMEFVEGTKLSKLTSIGATDLDGSGLARELCEAYLESILAEGVFHADPHPGNVLITPDGRLALIDLGMTSRLSPAFRRNLLRLVMSIGEGDSTSVTEQCIELGTRLDDFDGATFERRVTHLIERFGDGSIDSFPIGRLVFELGRTAAACGLRPPAQLAVVGKTMLHLDEVGAILDTRFKTVDVLRESLRSLTARELLSGLRPGRALSSALDMREFARQTPRRLGRLLQDLTESKFELRVHAFDERSFLGSIQRVGTRITLGLVLAALIVGAALIMRVETRHTLLGYPTLAVVLFLAAVAGGASLAVSIFIQDVWRRK